MKMQTFFFDAYGMEGDFSASLGFIIQFRQWHVIGEALVQREKLSGHVLGVSECQGDFLTNHFKEREILFIVFIFVM
jgi:hypothetical protein